MIFTLHGCQPDPQNPLDSGWDSPQCKASKARNKELLENLFAARFRPPIFARMPIGPRPTFADMRKGDPDPQPNYPDYFEFQHALNGELLANALRQSNPTVAIKELRDSGLVLEAATEVLSQLKFAADALEQEIGELKDMQYKCSSDI